MVVDRLDEVAGAMFLGSFAYPSQPSINVAVGRAVYAVEKVRPNR
ncbi:protein of unknown function [Methylocaldum szegediense]|uniref:Glucose-methanol-choline oxidoreductase C-terminal domain-containing protein n=1 Tax=Methylocaldum szegediense TaxID=73780 RepID=A0ABN8XAR3_9GAMM|nr:protein of unknown function [Methylocaldum szegediense]